MQVVGILLLPVVSLAFAPVLESPFFIPKTFALLVGSVLFATLAWSTGLPPRTVLLGPVGVLLACTAISAWHSQFGYLSWLPLFWLVAGVLMFYAACAAFGGREAWLMHSIMASGFAIATLTILQRIPSFDLFRLLRHSSMAAGRMRYFATLGNPDFVAAFLAAAFPAVLWLAYRGSVARALAVTGAILSTVALALTGSRAGLLGVAIVIAVFAIGMASTRQRRWLLVTTTFLIVLAAAGPFSRGLATTLRGRLFIWRVSMVDGFHLLGSGPGTFAYLYPTRLGELFAKYGANDVRQFGGYERHAESDFVEMASETGVLGLAAFLFLLGSWAKRTMRQISQSMSSERRLAIVAAMAGVAAVSVIALVDFPFHRAETWCLLWLWMAVPFAYAVEVVCRRVAWKAILATVIVLAVTLYAVRPLEASYHVSLGIRHEALGKASAAISEYRHALALDAGNDVAQFNLVRSLAVEEKYPEALQASYIAQRYIGEPELWLLRARIQEGQQDNAGAAATLREAIKRFPFDEELRKELAEIARSD